MSSHEESNVELRLIDAQTSMDFDNPYNFYIEFKARHPSMPELLTFHFNMELDLVKPINQQLISNIKDGIDWLYWTMHHNTNPLPLFEGLY